MGEKGIPWFASEYYLYKKLQFIIKPKRLRVKHKTL